MSYDESPRPAPPRLPWQRHTGIFASPTECAEIRALTRAAASTLVPAVSTHWGRKRPQNEAARRLHEQLDTRAREHGLPRIAGHYGIDLETGEFLRPTG